ncbi:MAG: glycosyl hydrolase [Bacteroidetes bacterium GWE2_41_25]|nr:MAG: glycosyl hydrolase [Bacteroidetes bacterium GWA2_40_15]OFX96159.1 MAG: glycosyl hydrolase [Bacteroidetes bacterium GWE2_41_25]OFY01553.1 MAG: glycosyl hydrolase [Bacteroidetes bacterium GWC2_40_22]HAM08960.1 glycosyl hydrolase [Bacteroidales bacterium]HBH85159.1 glycosyl hydrolase [Bacteroidales bacterium]
MILIDKNLKPADLSKKLKRFWQLSGEKIHLIEKQYDESKGSPVFTVNGKYSTRGWTEWTQGFQYGSAILHYDATGEEDMLDYARKKTIEKMAPHLSHIGVHDHGFNNVSTYGNLLRLMKEGKIPYDEWEKNFYELALKISGAVQASRWTTIKEGGFIHSFNGAHSLFVDTIRSCRALTLSYILGHIFKGEGDVKINMLERAMLHMKATAKYSVFYGEGRDSFDVWGRTAHESIFNVKDGNFRCPGTQQGYSGFTTWTRGLAWAMCGFAEQLEWIETINTEELAPLGGKEALKAIFLHAARATCDFYIATTPVDGVPYWDTGAPGLQKMGDYMDRKSDPFNSFEPVDSSAAAIASQGLLRLGRYLTDNVDQEEGKIYWLAGLKVIDTLLEEPYLSTDKAHQGLLLHTIYHRPNGWDHVPEGSKIPYGESCMWGDYHIREACLYLDRIISNGKYYTYFNCVK